MSPRLTWILKTGGLLALAVGAITAGVLLDQYGKALFNAAML